MVVLLLFPCFVLFDLLMGQLRVVPIKNLNNYNTVSRSMFCFSNLLTGIKYCSLYIQTNFEVFATLDDKCNIKTNLK